MSIEKKCVDCSVIIVDEWFFSCKGFMCDKVLSYSCAGAKSKKYLKKYSSDINKCMKSLFDGIQGLSWFCAECMHSMKQLVNSAMIQKATEEASKCAPIEQPVPITTRPVTRSQSKSIPYEIPPTQPERFVLLNQENTIDDRTDSTLPSSSSKTVVCPSTPVSSTFQLSSTTTNLSTSKASTMAIPNIEILPTVLTKDLETIRVVKPRRWIFISRIHTSVTDEQFKRFVENRFQILNLNAVRIIPKVNDYVSYRISVNDLQFEYMINSEVWPKGLFIKEFEFPRRQSIFRITGNNQQTT